MTGRSAVTVSPAADEARQQPRPTADETAEGVAQLGRWAHQMGAGTDKRQYRTWVATAIATTASGALMLGHTGLSVHEPWCLVVGAYVAVVYILSIVWPPSPGVFGLLGKSRAVIDAVPAVQKKALLVVVFVVGSSVLLIGLYFLWLFTPDSGSSIDSIETWRFVLMCLSPAFMLAILADMTRSGVVAMFPMVELMRVDAADLVDRVKAGMAPADIARDLLRWRAMVDMSYGPAYGAVFQSLAGPLSTLPAIVGIIMDASPSAYLLGIFINGVVLIYFVPNPVAQIQSRLDLLPQAIAERSLKLVATVGACAEVEPSEAESGHVSIAVGMLAAGEPSVDGGDGKEGASGGDGGGAGGAALVLSAKPASAAHTSGAAAHDGPSRTAAQAEAGAKPASELSAAEAAALIRELDALLLRLRDLRLGWRVFGVPLSAGVIAKLRALLVPIMGLVVREFVL